MSWPSEKLEWLGHCPVCGSQARTLLLDGLRDDIFNCAPGNWSLHKCHSCSNAYLDPRPDQQSIGDAYQAYYTHQHADARDDYASLGILRRLRRRAANGYTNMRYGTRVQPSSPLIGFFLSCMPPLRHALDLQFRWLPKPEPGSRLLDVGCGNGAFLQSAASANWEAHGVDPDPIALTQARQAGTEARKGGIGAYADMHGAFDAVTFSHSIEHVHDPASDLKAAWLLLRPGGTLYVDTPNVDSYGRKRYRAKWRGIEAPRHLVIFSDTGMRRLLADVGFSKIAAHPRYSVGKGMNISSMLLEEGRSPYERPSIRLSLIAGMRALVARLARAPEFITLTCVKDQE